MISIIGIKRRSIISRNNISGLSFIEVMVTLVIVSTSLLFIFKSYIKCLDHMKYLTNRIYSNIIVDNRIAIMERMFQVYNTIPFEQNENDVLNVGSKQIEFNQLIDVKEIQDFVDLFDLTVTVSWIEGNKNIRLSRSAYLFNLGPSY